MDFLTNIKWNKVTPCLVFLVIEILLESLVSECASQTEVNKHLELGRDFLARGQLSDALTHYHAAVEGDPHNYLTYFKRGTVYYALGKAKFALQDFSKVLELKADFTAARTHRANVYMKLAQYEEAREDFLQVAELEAADTAVALAQQLRETEALYRGGQHAAAAAAAARLLDRSPWSALLRQLRAECYIAMDDLLSAVSDLRAVNRLQADSTAGYHRLAALLYRLGHVSDALKEVRECLRLDPEHKLCFPLYKTVRTAERLLAAAERAAAAGDGAECSRQAAALLRHEPHVTLVVLAAHRSLCACQLREEKFSEARASCDAALELQRSAAVLCDRAEAEIGLEMYDDAIQSYQQALELEAGLQRAQEGLQRAQQMQKLSEQRDYYKILGVKRSATKQEIVKAYRRAAQKWHPDAYSGDEKKLAEKKFIDVAAAKEVLTDPEKRAQFDQGIDPLDPEGGAARGGRGPFQHFQHFQHGSPFQFKFHFN